MAHRILTETEACLLRVLDEAPGLVSRQQLRHRLVLTPKGLAKVLGRLRRKLDGSGVTLLSTGAGLDERLTLHVANRAAFDALTGWAPKPILPRPRISSITLPRVCGVAYAFDGRLSRRAAA